MAYIVALGFNFTQSVPVLAAILSIYVNLNS